MPVGGIFRTLFSGSNAGSRVQKTAAYGISLFSKTTFFHWVLFVSDICFSLFALFFWPRSKRVLNRGYFFLKNDAFQTYISRELVGPCYKRVPYAEYRVGGSRLQGHMSTFYEIQNFSNSRMSFCSDVVW